MLHARSKPNDLTSQLTATTAARVVSGGRARTSARAARGRSAGDLGRTTRSASQASEGAAQALHSQRQRRFKLQVTAGELLGGRLSYCGRRRRRGVLDVQIRQGQDGAAYATGLQRCGSVHSCPVCAARIAQQRRMEAITALTAWRAEGGVVSMLTLTLPHHAGQPLTAVLDAVTACTRYLNSGRGSMKTLLSPFGYIGQIRALEVTQGGNGWHPHVHVLVLTTSEVPEVVQQLLKARWEAAAVSHGWASPDWRVGATWQDGTNAASYVNKAGTWGMAEEVTLHTSKKGGNGGRTPFELLLDAALGQEAAGELFAEYGRALHGKRQQFWSRGLKARFGLLDQTDEEIVDGEDAQGDETIGPESAVAENALLAVVAPDYWRLVVRYEERAELLRAAEAGGQVAVDMVCLWLHQRYVMSLKTWGHS